MMMKQAFLIFALIFAACGDDQATGSTNPTPTESDAGPDARTEPDAAPDLRVPRFVTINMTPGRTSYAIGAKLLPEVVVYDLNGEVIPEALFDLTMAPGESARRDGDRWELLSEGGVTFTACALTPGADGRGVCGDDLIVVDNSPPVIIIEAPFPGEQIDGATTTIRVAGRATDTHGDVVVYINGQEVPVVAGRFETVVTPRFGVNHVEVTATDQVNPKSTISGVDFLWAPVYEPILFDKPGIEIDDAIVFWMGQPFVDDSSPLTRRNDGKYLTKDLVDILELVLRYVDLNQQIANPIIDSAGAYLTVQNIDIGKPRIIGEVVNGGIELYLQISDLLVTTQGGLDINGQVLNLSGGIEATMSALVRLNVTKNGTGPVQVTVGALELAVEDATSDFVSPEANAIFTLAQSALRSTLETLLVDTVEAAFVNQLPDLLLGTIGALDTALQNQSFDLNLGLGTPLTLFFDARMTRLNTFRRSRLEAGLAAKAYLDVPRVHLESRGIPATQIASVNPFFASSRIQIALKESLINGLLHCLWDAGMLDLDVTEQLPITAERAIISAKIQPLIRPPLEGQDSTTVLQVGQLELEVKVLGRTDRYGVNIETNMVFELVDGSLELVVDSEPRIITWVISSSVGGALLSPDGLETLIRTQVYPQLVTALNSSLSIALPVPDLSGLGTLAPALSAFEVEFGLARPVVMREGYLMVDATLDGTL
jgi:hypothetical protein